jgi:hypothetical protein
MFLDVRSIGNLIGESSRYSICQLFFIIDRYCEQNIYNNLGFFRKEWFSYLVIWY